MISTYSYPTINGYSILTNSLVLPRKYIYYDFRNKLFLERIATFDNRIESKQVIRVTFDSFYQYIPIDSMLYIHTHNWYGWVNAGSLREGMYAKFFTFIPSLYYSEKFELKRRKRSKFSNLFKQHTSMTYDMIISNMERTLINIRKQEGNSPQVRRFMRNASYNSNATYLYYINFDGVNDTRMKNYLSNMLNAYGVAGEMTDSGTYLIYDSYLINKYLERNKIKTKSSLSNKFNYFEDNVMRWQSFWSSSYYKVFQPIINKDGDRVISIRKIDSINGFKDQELANILAKQYPELRDFILSKATTKRIKGIKLFNKNTLLSSWDNAYNYSEIQNGLLVRRSSY